MLKIYSLSHAEALRIITAIHTLLDKEKKGAAIAVADAHGELIAFLRTDGCRLSSINIAINKAFTAARDGRDTKAVAQASRQEGFPMTNFGDLRYTAWAGGIPVMHQGQIVGAVGVSGLSEPEDVALVEAALKAEQLSDPA